MKTLKLAFAALIAALCFSAAQAQYQNVPPNVVGPLSAYGFPCNPSTAVGYPAVGAAGCVLGQSFGPASTAATFGTGTGACATAPSSIKGSVVAGSFVCLGTAGASTLVVNLPAAPNGWTCVGQDVVTAAAVTTSASTTTSATLKFTSTTNTDTISYSCVGF